MSFLDRVSRFIDDVLLLPEVIRDRLEAAEDALESGDNRLAADLFGEVLSERDSLTRAAVGLAQAREALGDLDGAAEALSHARALEPDDAEVALFDARVALARGDSARAARAARDAAGRAAGDSVQLVEACLLRARAERQRGRPDRAAREIKKALSIRRDDPALRAELVEVLAEGRRVIPARAAATGLAADSLDDAAATRLGLALEKVGARDLAAPWLARAAEGGSDAALLALARVALAEGRVEDAEAAARRAIARGAGAPALALLGAVLLQRGDPRDAAEAFSAASSSAGGDVDLLRRAVRVTPTGSVEALTSHADALERLAPGDSAARGARAFVALGAGDLAAARSLVAGDLTEPRLVLARVRLALAEDRARDALEILAGHRDAQASVEAGAGSDGGADLRGVDAALVAALRRDALRALWLGANGEVDLAAAIDGVVAFANRHDLAEAVRAASRLRDELDRPLLLAVLGEFNAGKSTFINAFVGADVAPTGIVPTTATLNVLRGGAERRVRVVRADGTTREGDYGDLEELLEAAQEGGEVEGGDEAEGGRVDHVEIVLPSEILERVWILDTPGTNAIDAEHERLAREASRRADAALWIFSAGQAGKETEGRMLSAMRDSGRAVVAVLNKVDRLGPGQLEEIQASLRTELGEIGAALPVSAKRALVARLADDEAAYVESGYPALLEALDERIFARSRELKRGACAGRLVAIVDAALGTESTHLADFEQLLGRLKTAEGELAGREVALEAAVDEAITHLATDLDAAFVQAAEEVLAFVRPRRSRFARHGADPEDRAFLAAALEARLGRAADALAARLMPRVRAILAQGAGLIGVTPAELQRRVRAAVMEPLSLYVGYQRGVLHGGGLRRFFENVLPSVDLEVDKVAQALATVHVDPRAELRSPLEDSLRELLATLVEERSESARGARVALESTAATVFGPLRALRAVLSEALPVPRGAGPPIA